MSFLSSASERSRRLAGEMGLGLFYRVLGLVAYAITLRILLDMLGPRQLGVWLVIFTMAQWVLFYDLGISSGARNEIARAAASGDRNWVRRAVATGWLYSALVAAGLFAICAGILASGSVETWIRVHVFDGVDGRSALWITLAGACLTLFLKFPQAALAALERASNLYLFNTLSSGFFLLALLVGSVFVSVSLAGVAAFQVAAATLANLVIIAKFRHAFPSLRWRRSDIDHGLRHKVLGFGLRLFVVQIAAMIIFSTDAVLVSSFVGPAEVVVYDAGLKIFSVVTMVHTLLMGTLWSSFTHAHARGDWAWIRSILLRLVWSMVPIVGAVVVLAILTPSIVRIWLGPETVGTVFLYFLFAAVTLQICWGNIFAYYLNGIGDLRLQLPLAIIGAVINIPVSYFFAVLLDFGIEGVLLGTIASLSLFSVAGPVSVFRQTKASACLS